MTTRYTHIRAKKTQAVPVGRQKILFLDVTDEHTGRPVLEDKGGTTVAWQYDDAHQKIIYALAHCSDKDNFCRKTGRAVSSGRLAAGKHVEEVPYKDMTGDTIISPSYKQVNEWFRIVCASPDER